MERKWIIASYGDIHGFGRWTSRARVTPEVKEPFLEKFYAIMEVYVRQNPNVYFKYLGDGFLVIRPFAATERRDVPLLNHLLSLKCLTQDIQAAIQKCGHPAPPGFRIRHADGDSYCIRVLDPNDPERKRTVYEFVEYVTNTGAHLLEINPGVATLATEGIVRALGKKRQAFRCRPLGKPSCYPKSVNREDADKLYVLD